MSEKKDYLGMFNVLKGILMLLIVWIHHESFMRGVMLSDSAKFPPLFRWSAGVMALFFVMAGYQYRLVKDMKAYVKKQFASLLVPYGIAVAVSAAFLLIWHIFRPDMIHLWDIRMLFLGGLYGTEHNMEFMGVWLGGVVGLWFLPTYCLSGILYQCIQRMPGQKRRVLAVWGLTLLGVSLPGNMKAALPFFAAQTCTSLGFWEIGRVLKEKKILYRKFSIPFVLGAMVLIFGCYAFSAANMASNVWKFWIVDYLAAAVFSVVILRIYVKSGLGTARGTGLLEYIGMYSMIFYCVHSVELLSIPWDKRLSDMLPFLAGHRMWEGVILALLLYLLRIAAILAVTALLNSLLKKIHRFRVKRNK